MYTGTYRMASCLSILSADCLHHPSETICQSCTLHQGRLICLLPRPTPLFPVFASDRKLSGGLKHRLHIVVQLDDILYNSISCYMHDNSHKNYDHYEKVVGDKNLTLRRLISLYGNSASVPILNLSSSISNCRISLC